MNNPLDILAKVVKYEAELGLGVPCLLMSLTIDPIKKLLEEGHTLDPNFFEEFSLPEYPISWYVDGDKVIRAKPL